MDTVTEVDAETGDVTERPMTDAEIKQRDADRKAAATAEAARVQPLSDEEVTRLRALLGNH